MNPTRTVYAVNCQIKEQRLSCGALYVETNHVHEVIRLSDSSAKLDVRLPTDLLDQPTPKVGWNVELPILNTDEQVQHSV